MKNRNTKAKWKFHLICLVGNTVLYQEKLLIATIYTSRWSSISLHFSFLRSILYSDIQQPAQINEIIQFHKSYGEKSDALYEAYKYTTAMILSHSWNWW